MSHYSVNLGKCCQICVYLIWFYFEKCQLQKSLNYFSVLQPMKNDVRFEYVSWKMSDFVSFSFFGLTLIRNLRNFDFGSHWNKQKKYMRYQYVLPNSVWFGLIFVIWVKN